MTNIEVIARPAKATAKKNKVSPNARRVSSTVRRQLHQQFLAGTAVTGVALTLTGLSLTHLAHGIHIVTGASTWEAWAMAIGVDLGFVAVEFAKLSVNEKLAKEINRPANAIISGTMVGSAILNAFAFAAQAEGWMVIPAVLGGLAIPAMIFGMTNIGAKLFGAKK